MEIFDQVIDRNGRNFVKNNEDFLRNVFKNDPDVESSVRDVIPLWVADMDFKSPPAVIEAIKDYADYGIFGYPRSGPKARRAAIEWYKRRHNWAIEDESLLAAPTVMFSVAMAIRALAKEGESVIIFQPVYPPFAGVVLANGRNLVVSELVQKEGRYEIDFDDFERKVVENQVKVLLFCSPHNPVGRVWSRDELERLAAIVECYGVKVISDEIHCDFVFEGHTHIPFATVSEYVKENSITCIAPTKTFNMAGVQGSFCVTANSRLKAAVLEPWEATGLHTPSGAAFAAMEAAYRYGGAWFDSLRNYIYDNIKLVEESLRDTKIKVTKAESTYLLWLDCREMEIPPNTLLIKYFLKEAHVWLNEGLTFGEGGKGFVRMNVASPRSVLKEALRRITLLDAVKR